MIKKIMNRVFPKHIAYGVWNRDREYFVYEWDRKDIRKVFETVEEAERVEEEIANDSDSTEIVRIVTYRR